MSFMGGGAECSTSGNPLSQLTKHAQDDKSLQRDRLVNRGPGGGALGGFRSMVPGSSGAQDESMNAFLHQAAALPEMAFDHGRGQVHIDQSHAVHLRAHSASPSSAHPAASPFSPADFAAFQRLNQTASARASPIPTAAAGAEQYQPEVQHQQQQQQQQQRPMMGAGLVNMGMGGMGMGMGMSYSPMARGMYQQPALYHPSPGLQDEAATITGKGKGKEKVVELDDHQWEEQFAQLELQEQSEKQEDQADKAGEQDESLAMEPELNRLDDELLNGETGFGDFESIWNGIQAENAAMGSAQWNSMGGSDWDLGTGRLGQEPPVEQYLFEEDNVFMDRNLEPQAQEEPSTTDPFAEGVRILDEGGNLSLAALAFEAAVQRDPGHVEAWVYLGSAQAQNEKEDAAIRALEQALKLDPNNLAALMGLAVSYTNEGYDSTSHRTLERWLSVRYPQVVSPDELSSAADLGFTDRQQLHDRVTDLFLRAARLAPDGDHMDPDVQVGLGVLFYGAEQYDKAVDCFAAALASSEQGTSNRQSQIHLLWNRLGATLANSGRSEDAISAYEKALSIRPNFVRARYNLGVSCINMNCDREAAGHLLAALAMHKSVETSGRERAREILGGDAAGVSEERLDRMATQNRSTTLYDTLRRVFTQMGRRDLADRVVVGVDPDSFRGDFDF